MTRPTGGPRQYAPHVRAQYEDFPFPHRNPRDEARRLVVAEQDTLAKINHYCFGGRQRFDAGFRVLVAGGGTGDHTIFLAEQLRDLDAGVTYLDISQTSLEMARGRARARGLENIAWHHGSILDLPALELGPFDLISCTGVLHHLPDPQAGLAALRRVLAPEGAMSLMLYGRFGRLGVYAGQELMRLLNHEVEDRTQRIRNARAALRDLPPTHWLLRGAERHAVISSFLSNDANLYDTLLHEQDRAYSVPEIYTMLERADLELTEFTFFGSNMPTFRYLYDPAVWITDEALRARIAALPRPVRQGIAEALGCVITCHAFYAAPSAAGRVASPGDAEMVPEFLYFDPAELLQRMQGAAGQQLACRHRETTLRFVPGVFSTELLAGIDGARTLGELFGHVRERVGESVPDSTLMHDFLAFYEPLNSLDALVLRHRSVPALPKFPLHP